MMKSSFKQLKPSIVLGVAAHPDDLDFGASASMASFASQGAKIYYLILTDGSKGSDDKNLTSAQLIKIRQNEQKEALKAIGGTSVTFLNYPDSALEVSLELKKDIVREIRRIKPDVVITNDPSFIYSPQRGFINHPDHRAAGQATLDAIFPLARDRLTYPDLLAEGLKPHKVTTALLTNFDNPNFFVDVSSTFDLKIKALDCHKSQIKDIKKVKALMEGRSMDIGKQLGVTYAEGFVRLDIP